MGCDYVAAGSSSAAVSDGPWRGWADASQPAQTQPHSPVLVAVTQPPQQLIPAASESNKAKENCGEA